MSEKVRNRIIVFVICLFLAAIASPALVASNYIVPQPSLKPLVGVIFFVIIGVMLPIALLSNDGQ